MPHVFDAGYASQPYQGLCESYPGSAVYPAKDFRLEWGPVFHRGRLDGSARVLVIGQDPAQHETIVRRILVGEAGHRIQGLLAKLGIDSSYVMVNTFVYSVYGQGGGNKHRHNAKIAAYRNRWLEAIFATSQIDAVIALGSLADSAWQDWRKTPDGKAASAKYVHVTHPTKPESAGGGPAKHAAAIKALLADWNAALQALHPLPHRDKARSLKLYGSRFEDGDRIPIPEADVPAGTPDWMRLDDGWADRPGKGKAKRATILVRVPNPYLP